MKSTKNIVRDILKAQGLAWDIEPTPEAIKVLSEALHGKWSEGYDNADYDHNEAME